MKSSEPAFRRVCVCQAAVGPPRGGWIRRKPVDFQTCGDYNGTALFFSEILFRRDSLGDPHQRPVRRLELLRGHVK